MRTAYETAKAFVTERREALLGVVIGTAATLAVGFGVKAIKAAKAITGAEEETEDTIEDTVLEEIEETIE